MLLLLLLLLLLLFMLLFLYMLLLPFLLLLFLLFLLLFAYLLPVVVAVLVAALVPAGCVGAPAALTAAAAHSLFRASLPLLPRLECVQREAFRIPDDTKQPLCRSAAPTEGRPRKEETQSDKRLSLLSRPRLKSGPV
eukprot:GHVT01032395.1.p1 GENE.GHVT01032395.1~~GHVT01032395.1.p1  ORF type:complete len:137 (-),score=35.46 GHVT01032395.1:290-700(-)